MLVYSLVDILPCLWFLIVGYFLRRRSLPKRSRWRIVVIIYVICTAGYLYIWWRAFPMVGLIAFFVAMSLAALGLLTFEQRSRT